MQILYSAEPHHVLKLVISVELYLLIDDVSLYEVLLEDCCGPTTECRSIFAVHSISHGNNHIKIVVWNLTNYLSFTFNSNLCIFCTG